MASPSYRTRALVLKKTKLGEADLIVTLLAEDGSLIRAVAKGARKPKSTFASRLELFSRTSLLLAPGKNLDIITEARAEVPHASLRDDVVRSAAASVAAELFGHLAQEDLPAPRSFDLMDTFLGTLETTPVAAVPPVLSAALLKAMAISGYRPATRTCLTCGAPVGTQAAVSYSFEDGGPGCDACTPPTQTIVLAAPVLTWVETLIRTPFAAVAGLAPDAPIPVPATADAAVALVQFADALIRAHCGTHLKSLGFFQTVIIPLIFPCENAPASLK